MCSRKFLCRRQLGICVYLFVCFAVFPTSSSYSARSKAVGHLNSKFNQQKWVSTQYRFPVNGVDSCPTDNHTWYRAGARLNCSHDDYNRLQYLCIPNQEKTTLIEFCYDQIMRLYEEGYCLHLSTSGIVNQENCSMFKEGCPKMPYFSSNIFQFPKCLEINKDLRCFLAEPGCQSYYDRMTNDSNCNVTTGNCSYTNLMPKHEEKHIDVGWFKVCVSTVTVVCLLTICGIILFWQKRRHFPSSIGVRQERNKLELSLGKDLIKARYRGNVTWMKDGNKIEVSKHKGKFTVISNHLYIHNLTEEDGGLYQAVGPRGKTLSAEIVIETAHLVGVETPFVDDSRHQMNKVAYVYKREGQCHIIIAKNEKTTESKLIRNIFTGEHSEEEVGKLGVHAAVLLGLITGGNSDEEEEIRWSLMFTLRIRGLFNNLALMLAASRWPESIISEGETLKLASDEVEIETLWVLFQTCPSPREVINYILRWKKINLLIKYFRLECYQRLDSEPCIYLPNSLGDKFIEALLNVFFEDNIKKGSLASTDDENGAQRNTTMDISKTVVKDIEDSFHQPTSSVFDCMLYYCLIKNEATKEFLSRVFRTSGYVKEENEKCICLSPDFTKKLIERLGADIILHKTISDTSSHPIVSEKLRIPEEILKWDHDARTRFVQKIGKDAVKIFRSRVMIVGCAGAGKTTLLKRLINRDMDEFPETKSTIGLEIHESLFKISDESDKLIALSGEYQGNEDKTLSIIDFAGQSAYYACHQVYLSRRALYILVIDLSKNPNEPVQSEQNFSKETLFDNWMHKDYYRFWMESICTYCDTAIPVILVGTHKDIIDGKICKDEDRFDSFLSQLPDDTQLQKHLHRKNYFEIGHPGECRDKIDKLQMCIVDMIQKQSTWGEIIPKLWEDFDQELCTLKGKRLMAYSDLKTSVTCKIPTEKEGVLDMLRFFHDCGKILFFNEKGLSEIIILDVQWFVDAFKNIITDKNHQTSIRSSQWAAFNETGILEEEHLIKIWKELRLQEMIEYKDQVLSYMQRLGLMAVGERELYLYVPSVNKHELAEDDFSRIENANHTSILKFSFPNFLPHFYFYRLVVASLEEWKAQIDGKVPLLFKNAAFLKYKDRCHRIVLGVSGTQIHLQIYTCNSKPLQRNITLRIRSKIESFLTRLTQTFHKPVDYVPGYTCRPTKVTEEHEDSVFIPESEAMELYLADPSESLSPCPKHDRNPHNLRWKSMLLYWKRRSELLDTCCQRLFSSRRSHQRSNKQIKWKKKDINAGEEESFVKMI